MNLSVKPTLTITITNDTKNLEFKMSLNNITDKQYFTKRPSFYPGPGIWSSDGRSLTVTVIFRL
jgi:Fe(3+) dicitrate transport protein